MQADKILPKIYTLKQYYEMSSIAAVQLHTAYSAFIPRKSWPANCIQHLECQAEQSFEVMLQGGLYQMLYWNLEPERRHGLLYNSSVIECNMATIAAAVDPVGRNAYWSVKSIETGGTMMAG